MALKRTVAVLLSLNLLFFATLSSSSALPPPPTPPPSSCPIDIHKLGVCANLLRAVDVMVGSPATAPCCSLIDGLLDIEAAVCLCTALRANILGINLDISYSLSILLNDCGKSAPSDFQCA